MRHGTYTRWNRVKSTIILTLETIMDKRVNNRNLRRTLEYTPLPRLKHGLVYNSDIVERCGNEISPGWVYLYDRINIHRVDGDLKYDDHNWSCCFKSLHSKELEDGIYHGRHSDWMCVLEFMEAYESGIPVAPVVVDGTRLDDGNHRLYAQYKLGYDMIDAFLKQE